jgi:hemolysin III
MAPQEKPRLRGVSHQIAFFVALVAAGALVATAPSSRAAAASAIYGVTLATLFGVSALYHRPNWAPPQRQIMRRLDHSAIFLLIAGTYTPLFWLLDPIPGHRPLWIVWIGAALGIGKSMLWPNAPKAITAALCLLLGWAVVGDVVRLAPAMGAAPVTLLVVGGVIYSLGAIVYARKKPDPVPLVFGYHEVFHALVIVAAVCHFVHVARIIHAAPAASASITSSNPTKEPVASFRCPPVFSRHPRTEHN